MSVCPISVNENSNCETTWNFLIAFPKLMNSDKIYSELLGQFCIIIPHQGFSLITNNDIIETMPKQKKVSLQHNKIVTIFHMINVKEMKML